MKILYIANHLQENSNDDEGAITHALNQLGHDVQRLKERNAHQWHLVPDREVVLFHKFDNTSLLQRMRSEGLKTVFWYFDLVDWPSDPSLKRRCDNRKEWMQRNIPHTDLGFCTDGDWVNQDQSGKLSRLTQGADNRVMGFGQEPTPNAPALLFTGTPNGGIVRRSFVDEMQITYKQTFNCVNGVHGPNLANLIAGSRICIAPDSPVTDQYWSNRVYITCGFGGFLLHPYCKTLAEQYKHDEEIVFYTSRKDLHERVYEYYRNPMEARRIGDNALRRTMSEHTYVHRVAQMMDTIQRRLF